jgi:hypothetical protein
VKFIAACKNYTTACQYSSDFNFTEQVEAGRYNFALRRIKQSPAQGGHLVHHGPGSADYTGK